MMKINRIIIAATLMLAGGLTAHAGFTGRVFDDRNSNGVYDKGDKALAGVAVTDGLNVALTGSDGSFDLPGYDGNRFISVTVPSGFMAVNNHYIPIADGAVYDFPLAAYPASIGKDGSHSFIQVTDSEIFNTTGNELWVDDIHRYASGDGSAFVIHTGDICYDKGLRDHIRLMNSSSMGIPVYYCIGNHDLVDGRYGEELFESLYGPVYYSFNVGDTHYVVTPMAGGDRRPSYTTDQVARWLRNDLSVLKPGTPVVVFNHDLPFSGDRFIYGAEEKLDLNAANLKAWVYGHWHINYEKMAGDVLTVCTSTPDKGGIDHSTGSFRVFRTDGDGRISTELRYPYIHDHAVVASPKGVASTRTVTVNAYSSVSQVKSVTVACYDGDKAVVKKLRLRRATDWSWTAELPAKAAVVGRKLVLKAEVIYESGSTEAAESEFVYSDPVAPLSGADWTNLLGNAAHNGGATSATIDSIPSLAWVTNVGANIFMTSPLVYGGRIFTASVDEDMRGEAAVYALDAATGALCWKTPVKASVKNSIAIAAGNLFAQDADGNLYAFRISDGSLAWSVELPIKYLPGLIDGLAAAGDKVFAGSGKALTAFDAASGRMLWRNEGWEQREGTTSTLAVGDSTVIGSVQWGALYGNDEADGKLLWSNSSHGLRNRGATPAIYGSLAYLVSDDTFFIIETRSGRIVARRKLPFKTDATSTPLLTGSEIIFGTSENGIAAIDSQTFDVKWTSATGRSLIFTVPYTRPDAATVETSPVLAGNTVFVAASDGTIYGIDRRDGKVTWSYAAGAPIFSSVAVSGNALYVTDFGGNVYCFR